MAVAGLDDVRLDHDLRSLLRAKKGEFYQGQQVAIVPDNGVRMRAVELLADLLGRKKHELDLTHHNDDGLTLILERDPSDPDPSA